MRVLLLLLLVGRRAPGARARLLAAARVALVAGVDARVRRRHVRHEHAVHCEGAMIQAFYLAAATKRFLSKICMFFVMWSLSFDRFI